MTFQAMQKRTAPTTQHYADEQTQQHEYVIYENYEEDNMEAVALSGIHPLTLLVVILVGLGTWAGIFYVASLILNMIAG